VATGQVRGDRADPVQRAAVKEPPNTNPDDQDRDVLGDPTPWARCEPRWTQGIQWAGPGTVWEVNPERP
jgi:hypothetical protein